MKIAKEFHWEMGHRLPDHFGNCRNIHGHSYKLIVELQGELNSQGMIMDYYDLKNIVHPVIDQLDHSFMVHKDDTEIISFLEKMKSKKVIVDFQSTVENIAFYILKKITERSLPENIKKVRVKVFESIDDYAEDEVLIN